MTPTHGARSEQPIHACPMQLKKISTRRLLQMMYHSPAGVAFVAIWHVVSILILRHRTHPAVSHLSLFCRCHAPQSSSLIDGASIFMVWPSHRRTRLPLSRKFPLSLNLLNLGWYLTEVRGFKTLKETKTLN